MAHEAVAGSTEVSILQAESVAEHPDRILSTDSCSTRGDPGPVGNTAPRHPEADQPLQPHDQLVPGRGQSMQEALFEQKHVLVSEPEVERVKTVQRYGGIEEMEDCEDFQSVSQLEQQQQQQQLNQHEQKCQDTSHQSHHQQLQLDVPFSSNSETRGTQVQLSSVGMPELVGRAERTFGSSQDNFLRGCKWSPDGSCILVCSNDNTLSLFNLPQKFLGASPPREDGDSGDKDIEMSSVLDVREGEMVYDFAWYPPMSSLDAETCIFVASCRDHPVHLWDAYTGGLRATYRPYNHLDEITAPKSVAFNPSGKLLYCGFDNCLRIFDVTRPGRQTETKELYDKKSAVGVQGIVSCIAFSPLHKDLYAVGTYSRSIGLFSEECSGAMSIFSGIGGGVTHMMFSSDGNYLYSGGRKDPDIVCWDLRSPGKVLFRVSRSADTNQRMYFDLDMNERYVLSGHQNGTVGVWDTHERPDSLSTSESVDVVQPAFSFLAHNDCVNSISSHPCLPILASGSGQRKFPLPNVCKGNGNEDMNSSSDSSGEEDEIFENSLKLWHFSGTPSMLQSTLSCNLESTDLL